MGPTSRLTTSVPGALEAELTEAEVESVEAELKTVKFQFLGLMAGDGNRTPAII